jgi:hypothetical protein
MHTISEDDPRVEDQWFYIIELGIRVRLRFNSEVGFTGLLHHGGTQPVYRKPRQPGEPIHIRINLINYCPMYSFNSRTRIPLAGDDDGELIIHPPENVAFP